MKKLYILAVALAATTAFAQTLQTDNFDAYTTGNLGTDYSGSTAGQGGWYLFGNGTATAASATIAPVTASYGKSLVLKGSSSATGIAAVWQDGLDTKWTSRTAGNDIVHCDFDFYTGSPVGSGAGLAYSVIYNDDYSIILSGIGFDYNTGQVVGIANVSDATNGDGNYLLILSTTVYPANTWIHLGYTYNYTTGALTFTTPDGVFSADGASAETDPYEMDFESDAFSGNTVAHTSAFDNYILKATNTTLATAEVGKTSVQMYPNPTSDFVVFSGTVKEVQIFDTTGKRLANQQLSGNKLDVRQLPKGIYMVRFETDKGLQTQKLIKN